MEAIDFAEFIRDVIDNHYPNAEKILMVMDNLNIHCFASLYKAFEPREARRIAAKLEIHHTPKHASWLNMAEIEIGLLSRQCLLKPYNNVADIRRNVAAWQNDRNSDHSTVHWHFTTADARI